MRKIIVIFALIISFWSTSHAQCDSVQVDSFCFNIDSTEIVFNNDYLDSIIYTLYLLSDTSLSTYEMFYESYLYRVIQAFTNNTDPFLINTTNNQRIFCPTAIDNNCIGCDFNDLTLFKSDYWTLDFGNTSVWNGTPTYQSTISSCFHEEYFNHEHLLVQRCLTFSRFRLIYDNFGAQNIDPNISELARVPCWNGYTTSNMQNKSLCLGRFQNSEGSYPPIINKGTSISVTKTIEITENDTKFTFDYAYVFTSDNSLDLIHTPMFWIEVRDANTNIDYIGGNQNVSYDLGYGLNIPITADIDQNEVQSFYNNSQSRTYYYKDWNCGTIDLSDLPLGTVVDIHFRNRSEVPEVENINEIVDVNCDIDLDIGYVYLDNLNNSICSNITTEPEITISEANYSSCTCTGEVCVDYTLPEIAHPDDSEQNIVGTLDLALLVYHDNVLITTLTQSEITSGDHFCFDLSSIESYFTSEMEGIDFTIIGEFQLECYDYEPFILGSYKVPTNTGQDNQFNNDIIFETCPQPTFTLLGGDQLCADENGLDGTANEDQVKALFDVNLFEDYGDNFKLHVKINAGDWVEIENYLDYIDEVGHFSYPVHYHILDCPIDCKTPFLKFTQYQFKMSYFIQDCLAVDDVSQNESEPIIVNVYPPLRDAPYYTDANCARPNVLVSYVRPCYKGTNGVMDIDVDCIIGGIQNLQTCMEKVRTSTYYNVAWRKSLPNSPMAFSGKATVIQLPEEIDLLTDDNQSTVAVEIIEYNTLDDENNTPVATTSLTLELLSDNSVLIPETFLDATTTSINVNITYQLVLSNSDEVEIESSNSFVVRSYNQLGSLTPRPHRETVEDEINYDDDNTYNGSYNFTLHTDAIKNNTWDGACSEYIGVINGATCGIVSFNNDEVMHEGDYYLQVSSDLGCNSLATSYDTVIEITQLEIINTGFTKDVYFWCTDEPLELEINYYAGNLYSYSWDRPEVGVINPPYIKTLSPYTCAGGEHTLTITRPGGTNDGTQTCTIVDKTFVVDFNPPPLMLDRYEDAIGIGAAKFKSTWLNDFNDVQADEASVLQELRDRNPYATAQAGVFKAYQSYDYLDDRRQFLSREDAEIVSINNETETILETDGVIGMPEDYTILSNNVKKTFTKGFAWNHPMLATCAPEWTFNSEITKYNAYNFETENKDILDRYSSALYGYGGKLTTAVAANAAYNEIAFESFEEYAGNGLADIQTVTNQAVQFPTLISNIEVPPLANFEQQGLYTITIVVDPTKVNLTPNMGFSIPAQVRLYVSTQSNSNNQNLIWNAPVESLSTSTTITRTATVNLGDNLYVAFAGSDNGEIEEDFITVTISRTQESSALFHQFNNSTGNFDFVTQNKAGAREYLTPYKVISGFGNYAIIDLPYSAVCNELDSDKMLIKFAAESLEFECREQNNIKEVVGDKTLVAMYPDECETNEEVANTMIKFDDSKAPGFSSNNNVQYWNGTIYKVDEKEVASNVTNLERGVSFTNEAAHSGEISLKIEGASTSQEDMVNFKHPDLKLLPNKEYLISAWVRTAEFDNLSPIALRDYNLDNEIGLYITVGQMPNQFFTPSGPIIEGWQRVEAVIKVPQVGGDLSISFNPIVDMYLDDIRLHPVNGGMQTYVFDLEQYRLKATLDHNNYATFYYYDDEGNLFHVAKETMQGVKTIQVSSSFIKPN
jgi:hypothetical protein